MSHNQILSNYNYICNQIMVELIASLAPVGFESSVNTFLTWQGPAFQTAKPTAQFRISVYTSPIYTPQYRPICSQWESNPTLYKNQVKFIFTKVRIFNFFSESCSLTLGHPECATKSFIDLKLFAVQASASPESNPSLYKNQVKKKFGVFEGFIYDMNPVISKACQLKH